MTIVGLKIDRFNLSGARAQWSSSDLSFWLVDCPPLGLLIGQNDNTAQGEEVNNPGRRTRGTRTQDSPRWRLVSGNKSLKPIISQGHWRVPFLQIDTWVSLPWADQWRDLKDRPSYYLAIIHPLIAALQFSAAKYWRQLTTNCYYIHSC